MRANRVFVVSLAIGVAGSMALFYSVFHSGRLKFEDAVHVGQSKRELMEAVGQPDEVLVSGDTLEEWGNRSAEALQSEAWVYYVFPGSFRFCVVFDDGRVAEVRCDST